MKTREEFEQFIREMANFELANARQKIRSLCQGLADALEADAERRINTIAREVIRLAPIPVSTSLPAPIQSPAEQNIPSSTAAHPVPQEIPSPEAA